MHMANELLSPATAFATLAVGAVAVAIAAARTRKTVPADKQPLMGVMGAFVFAGQMINFTLPGMPGTSGHLGGGVLLAILLGPSAGIVVISAVLIVQCLLFQDGGLLALGCNIINMGVVPCLLGGWLYKAVLGEPAHAKATRQYLAAWVACIAGLSAGAAMVPLETSLGDRLAIPTGDFLAVMTGVHLFIGLIEGLITFAVIAYIRAARPQALGLAMDSSAPARAKLSRRAFGASLIATSLLLSGVVCWFASTHPDGLEWAYQKHTYAGAVSEPVRPAEGLMAAVDSWQAKWSLMADYSRRPVPLGEEPSKSEKAPENPTGWGKADGWKSLAGLLGTGVTMVILYATSVVIRRRRKLPA